MNLRRTSIVLPFLLLCSLLALDVSAKETAPSAERCLSTGWPHEQSDLTPDPALTFGTLENGLRYVIMPNHEPKNRVGLYLNIQSGSLNETEKQRSVAHYLEHMLFNGTTHYPTGKLVEYFQSIGMAFGPDTNAHTSYDETVYKLLLPNGEKKTVSEGLQVFAWILCGRCAVRAERRIERERGIILAEKRDVILPPASATKQIWSRPLLEHSVAQRDVIGTDKVLKNADAALLRQYYEQWYRPEQHDRGCSWRC